MKTTINGVELAFEHTGSGPAILFIHDGPDNRAITAAPLATLSKAGFRVVVSNLRGFEPTPSTCLEDLTRDAVALLGYLGIGRAIVFGIGRGGYVLLDLLEKHPGRVAASSFVVPPAAAEALRRISGRDDLREALREGRLEALKKELLNLDSGMRQQSAPLADLPGLRQWIEQVGAKPRSAKQGGLALLADLQLPPLLIEAAIPENRRRSRRFGRIGAFGGKLQALFDLLAPEVDGDYEEEDLAKNL